MIRIEILVGLVMVLSSCTKSGTGVDTKGPLSCAEISDSVFTGMTGEPRYRVLKPNGGESVHVGDTLHVLVTAKEDSEAVVGLLVKIGNSFRKISMPGAPPNRNFNPRSRCDLSFVVPDAVDDVPGKKISLISDSVKVRIAKYSAETFYFDYSDGFFRIIP